MAGGREFTKHQQGIINRYYEHADTLALQRLGETVSELYLAEGNARTKLWNAAKTAIEKLTAPDDPRVAQVFKSRDVAALARLVTALQSGAKAQKAAGAQGGLSGSSSAVAKGEPVVERLEGAPSAAPSPSAPAASTSQDAAPTAAVTPEQLKSALKMFRKRLKLARLDDESRLGRSPMSSGKQSQIRAIMAPREFPQAVWQELVKQGKLRSAGGSFYELTDE